MAKPRRKHMGANNWARSVTGRAFLLHLEDSLGPGWVAEAFSYRRAHRQHAFILAGPLATASLLEQQETRVGGCWRSVTQFIQQRWTIDGSGIHVMTYIAYRPDRWLYADEQLEGPPAGLSKAAVRRWWDQEAARVGDERDTLTSEFIADKQPQPLDLERGLVARALFRCAICGRTAARAAWWPIGEPCTEVHPDNDRPRLARITVAYDGRIIVWAELPGFTMFDQGRDAVRAHDPRALHELHSEFAPFWCPRCDECYCPEHRHTGPARVCPRGHAITDARQRAR